MGTKSQLSSIPHEVIVTKIHLLRNQKIILDKDLAELYGVTTGNLNKAVKRNLRRFPADFMFQLNEEEFKSLMFQSGISKTRHGGTRKLPFAFTEQGVAMLSGVLTSERAIHVNIEIIRIFIKLREMLLTHKDILIKLDEIESQVSRHNKEIQFVFDALKQLLQKPEEERSKIGFKTT